MQIFHVYSGHVTWTRLVVALLALAGVPQHAHARPDGTLKLGCPSFQGPGGESFRLKVTKWCDVKAPRRQWQIKVQISLTNTGKKPLDTGLSHIRLAMTHFNPARWTPPSRIPGVRPYKTTFRGQRIWLVPANPDGAAEPFPPPAGNFTFATHWKVPNPLQPGKTFRPSYHRGDAVFYVPRSRRQARQRRLAGVIGIAYVDGPQIRLLCPPERWGPKVPASSF